MAHCSATCERESSQQDAGRLECVGVSSIFGSCISRGNCTGSYFDHACNQGKPSKDGRQLVPASTCMLTPRCCSHSLAPK